MASNVVNVQMGDVMKDVTMHVEVRGVRGYRVRFWIGSALIRLAARVLQCRVEICGREVGQ